MLHNALSFVFHQCPFCPLPHPQVWYSNGFYLQRSFLFCLFVCLFHYLFYLVFHLTSKRAGEEEKVVITICRLNDRLLVQWESHEKMVLINFVYFSTNKCLLWVHMLRELVATSVWQSQRHFLTVFKYALALLLNTSQIFFKFTHRPAPIDLLLIQGYLKWTGNSMVSSFSCIWNKLPYSVWHCTTLSSFKSNLKTYFFLTTFLITQLLKFCLTIVFFSVTMTCSFFQLKLFFVCFCFASSSPPPPPPPHIQIYRVCSCIVLSVWGFLFVCFRCFPCFIKDVICCSFM